MSGTVRAPLRCGWMTLMSSRLFQQIKNGFIIPGAWDSWKEYRNRLTALIREKAIGPKDSLLILGAGGCCDIDLNILAEHCEKIVLLDTDSSAMREALARYHLETSSKVSLACESLTGISESDIEAFFQNLLAFVMNQGVRLTEEAFRTRTLEGLQALEQKLYINGEQFNRVLVPESCDAVVCAGVHSQLFSLLSYSWKVLAANVSEQIFRRTIKEEWFHKKIRGWNDGIIPMLDKAMIHAAKKKALFGCEYDPVSPIEGACQCISDLRRNSSEIGSLVWPFDPEHGKQYVMSFFLCNNS